MSLRYALMAILTVEPMTGYDLSKLFQQSVSHVWNAPDSQIYPELRRMESEGLLIGKDVPWGPRSTKREYGLSPEGRSSFEQWMQEPVAYFLERDPVHLRAAYLEWADGASARRLFGNHKDYYAERLSDWRIKLEEINALTNPLLIKRLAGAPSADHERIVAFKRLTYEGLIARADAEIAWAERGLDLLDALSNEAVT